MASRKDGQFDLELPYQEAKALVKTCIEGQQPVMMHGKPGIGKSDMIKEIGRELGRNVVDIRLALLDSVDIKGYPYLQEIKHTSKNEKGEAIEEIEKVLSFAINKEFPRDPDSTDIIFFDEINAAQVPTQLAMYQMILDRAIGEYKLPKGVSMVAAGNREADKGATGSMPKPLENRFVHLEMNTDFKSWISWAIEHGVNVEIIGYIGKNEKKLNEFDPSISSRAFPTPRSWAKASDLFNFYLKNNSSGDEKPIFNIIAGNVGVPTAMEFMAYRKIANDLPSADDILNGKKPKLKKDGIDISYMLTTNVMYKIREMYKAEMNENKVTKDKYETSNELSKKINNFFEYLIDNEKTIGEDFCVLPIKMLYNNYKVPINIQQTPAMMQLIKKHGDLLSIAFDKGTGSK